MLADYKEESIKCNGRLGQYFTLYLRVQHKIIEANHKIFLRLRITRERDVSDEDINKLVELKENQVTVQLRAADKVLSKKSISLDFMSDLSNNIVLLEYEYEINNEQTLTMLYFGDIIISNDKSDYLTNTTIKSSLVLIPIKQDRLFIDLIKLKSKKLIDNLPCYNISISTTIKPDFLEYKINQDSWIKLNDISFDVPIENYLKYIQVRGKKNNEYTYSNVIRIDPEVIK